MSDLKNYALYNEKQEEFFESICRQCGKCCGSDDGDPCLQLKKLEDGSYTCEVYLSRLGPQETVRGNKFNCIPIGHLLNKGKDILTDCAYREYGLGR